MENSFATIKDTLYSYRIQLSMPFHSYDFLVPMIFLSYESKEPLEKIFMSHNLFGARKDFDFTI
jgi:hypothetical protein